MVAATYAAARALPLQLPRNGLVRWRAIFGITRRCRLPSPGAPSTSKAAAAAPEHRASRWQQQSWFTLLYLPWIYFGSGGPCTLDTLGSGSRVPSAEAKASPVAQALCSAFYEPYSQLACSHDAG